MYQVAGSLLSFCAKGDAEVAEGQGQHGDLVVYLSGVVKDYIV